MPSAIDQNTFLIKTQANPKSRRFLRLDEVILLTGLSKSTIWRLEKVGNFPQRRKLSIAAVGWLENEVIQWANNRPNSRPPQNRGGR